MVDPNQNPTVKWIASSGRCRMTAVIGDVLNQTPASGAAKALILALSAGTTHMDNTR